MLEKLTRRLTGTGTGTGRQAGGIPRISCILIVHDMAEQAENTLRSLYLDYQRDLQFDDYEVIVVENASANPMRAEFLRELPDNFHYYLRENAQPSPGPAINFGVARSRGENVCVLIDGARLLTPGVLSTILLGHKLSDSTLVSIPGYHLGHELQQEAVKNGYDRGAERALLASANWPQEAYRLFEIACLNGSSGLGFFLPNSESNCVSLPRHLWDALGGYDESFDLAGGGLVNLDFYKRACEHPGVMHVIAPGEGTFHQLHGGVTTGGKGRDERAAYIEASNQQYRKLRGADYENPRTQPVYLGEFPPQVQKFVLYSAELAMKMKDEQCLGKPY